NSKSLFRFAPGALIRGQDLIYGSHQLLNLRSQQRQDAGGYKQSKSDAAVEFDQLHGVVGNKKGRKVTGQLVAKRSCQKPNAHHYAEQLQGSELRNGAKPHRTQAHLTNYFEKV